jgi:hypothetical protein
MNGLLVPWVLVFAAVLSVTAAPSPVLTRFGKSDPDQGSGQSCTPGGSPSCGPTNLDERKR